MRCRWILGLALAAAGACSGDAFSFDEGSVRGLAIVGTIPDLALVEYGAPPLRERRRRALSDAAGNLQVLVTDQARGGFVAVRWAAAIASWSLERYGPDWTVSRRGRARASPGRTRFWRFDPATGALFATTYQPVGCQTCFPTVDGVVVVDLAKRRVAVHEILALPVSLVP